MPLRINGHELPGWVITGAIIAILSFGAMQLQVRLLADEIKEHKAKPTHPEAGKELATITANQENIKESVKEIKEDVKSLITEIRRELNERED